jgi:MFS family permease
MRTFVVLYITKGLGQPLSTSSAVLATVAVGYVAAALGSGPLGDRFGLARVIFGASFVYGTGLLVAGLAQEWHNWYYGLILPVAAAGGTVMTLSWALLFKLMPAQHRGAIAGLATTTKGLGLLVGPLVAGIMIDVLSPYLNKTDGYQALWPVCAVPVLAAIPLVASLIQSERTPSGKPETQPS